MITAGDTITGFARATCGHQLRAGDVVRIFHFEDDRDIGTARVVEVDVDAVRLEPADEKAPQPATLYAWRSEGDGHYQDHVQASFYLERSASADDLTARARAVLAEGRSTAEAVRDLARAGEGALFIGRASTRRRLQSLGLVNANGSPTDALTDLGREVARLLAEGGA